MPFQIIISGIWLFALIFNFPLFLVTEIGTNNKRHYCVEIFPERWMEKAYPLTWMALIDLSLVMMVVLYSKVVQTLWFKRNEDNQLTCQQKVSIVTALSYALCAPENFNTTNFIQLASSNNQMVTVCKHPPKET